MVVLRVGSPISSEMWSFHGVTGWSWSAQVHCRCCCPQPNRRILTHPKNLAVNNLPFKINVTSLSPRLGRRSMGARSTDGLAQCQGVFEKGETLRCNVTVPNVLFATVC